MDGTMFQLRSFVQQRLSRAAEEILGEVEKTITLALYEAEVSRSKEEVKCLQHQLDLRKKSAEEPSLTSSTVEHGDERDVPLLQDKPGPSTPEKSKFSPSAEDPGPSQTSAADMDKNNWNYCLVQVGEVCLQGFLPESLLPQIPLSTSHPELASLKMPRRMKRKRTAGPYPKDNSLDPPEQSRPLLTPFPSTSNTCTTLAQSLPQPLITTNLPAAITNTTATTTAATAASVTSNTAVLTHSTSSTQNPPASIKSIKPSAPPTQHKPTATSASSTPKIFKEICSILPLSSGGKKKRCKITVEELARRVGPPEYMSFSSLVAYLRADNNSRKELQAQLEEAGIKPSELTTEMSLFSRLCEEEVDALCESLADLVQDHLPFQGIHVIPEAEDELVTLGKVSEFRSHLRRAIAAIKERVEAVDLASHGFMSKMLDIILSLFERCLDNQMSSRPIAYSFL